MEAAYIDAKKGMLKQLANKMYKMELDAWKKGDGAKPEAVPKDMKETKAEVKKAEKETPKMNKHVKDMVRGFFKEKADEGESKDVRKAGYVRRKQVGAGEAAPTRKRRRKVKNKD